MLPNKIPQRSGLAGISLMLALVVSVLCLAVMTSGSSESPAVSASVQDTTRHRASGIMLRAKFGHRGAGGPCRSFGAVTDTMKRLRPMLLRCYRENGPHDSAVQASFSVGFLIASDGSLDSLKFKSTTRNPRLDTLLLEIVKGLRFEPVASGGFDEVGYSYRLE